MKIQSEMDFRAALASLSISGQRQVGAAFVEHVLDLTSDARIKQAVVAAQRADISDGELGPIYIAAKSACVESFTHCGTDADWQSQAGHFVAEAAKACVLPAAAMSTQDNLAWSAAMAARMAQSCAGIAQGGGTDHHEAEFQYQLLESYLAAN